MLRKIIQIDADKCNGCGLCVHACHEGAIGMVDGKAKLLRDDYCDGLGDCLPACPTGAISFTVREAAAYDAAAQAVRGCPGGQARSIKSPEQEAGQGSTMKQKNGSQESDRLSALQETEAGSGEKQSVSQLRQWPVQIKLAPLEAPYFQDASLLIAADCTAYAYGEFHRDFIRGRIALVGCPKLDMVDYAEKLAEIFRRNEIRDVTVVRMEVTCCGGIEQAVKKALQDSGKSLPWKVVTISIDGKILSANA